MNSPKASCGREQDRNRGLPIVSLSIVSLTGIAIALVRGSATGDHASAFLAGAASSVFVSIAVLAALAIRGAMTPVEDERGSAMPAMIVIAATWTCATALCAWLARG